MTLTVRALGNQRADEEAWDRFVRSSADGTIFHLLAWKRVVHEIFGHTPRYLLAADGDDIKGILPLFEVHGLLTGRVLVSTPYAVYGGLCTTNPEAAQQLLSAAHDLAARYNARYVELRQLSQPREELPTKEVDSLPAARPDPEVNCGRRAKQRR
jgi:hypothetical protein